MRRTPFRAKPKPRQPRPDRSAEFASWTPSMRKVGVYAPAGELRAAPKDPEPVRDEDYRRWVASLPCAHCGAIGMSQAAHADSAGKGMGIKSSDTEIMPLCGPSLDRPGCHWLIGTSGSFSKSERRELERRYVTETKNKNLERA